MSDEKKLSKGMHKYIDECAEQIDYGKIIIDLNEHVKHVSITVELKKRFDKE